MAWIIETAEAYHDRDDEKGFAMLDRGGQVAVNSLSGWTEILTETEDKEVLKELLPLWDEQRAWWCLPGRPNLERGLDATLQRDIMRFFNEHVWFADPRTYELVANWCMAGWLQDDLGVATRLAVVGPTQSGKSRLITCLQLLSRRGFKGVMPTGPSLYRLIEAYDLTITIDEFQDLSPEARSDVLQIFKGGFEPGVYVPRTNDKGKVERFSTFAPMVIGFIPGNSLREDIENRAITIHMLQKPSDAELDSQPIRRRIDEAEAYKLSTRLFAMRLWFQAEKARHGDKSIEEAINRAFSIAEGPVQLGGESVQLNDRSIQMAGQLLTPGLLLGDHEDTLQLIAENQRKASQSLGESLGAKTFSALQVVIEAERRSRLVESLEFDVSRICITDVANQYNQDLIDKGDQGRERVPTRKVGDALRGLGFETTRGHGNKTYLRNEGFWQRYRIYVAKYGHRSMVTARPREEVTA